MILNINNLSRSQVRFAEHIGIDTSIDGCVLNFQEADNLFVKRENNTITIGYSKKSEMYRGMALLKSQIEDGETINQPSRFDSLAAFADCSRNAVLKTETVKNFIMDIAALGYNELYLYTEDTFEIKEYSYFGHLRGKYSEEEIKELDSFALEYGIELIPAVQTLAHLNAAFHWKQFDEIRDTTDILLCEDEKTYEFIDRMLATLRRMYTTDKINIGMDEAHMLGLGKYLDKNGYHDKMEIFLKHISRVMELIEKNGFKKPVMWSDMFFKIACGKCNYDALNAEEFSKETLDLIPDNMTLAYWNYSGISQEYYDNMFEAHLKMGREIVFTGGFKKWCGFCPNLKASFASSRIALNSIFKYNIKKAIVTGWGDDGAECPLYAMLPGLVLYSEKCYTNDMSDEAISNKLESVFGYTLQNFMALEKPNRLPDVELESENIVANSAKIILWNDPLLGQYDKHILEGTNEYFSNMLEELRECMNSENRLNYVFENVYYLSEVLALKSEIGNKLYKAYQAKNLDELRNLKNTVSVIVERLDKFHKVFRKNWNKENKVFGFDVQDIRFGALRARLVYTEEVLAQYLDGEVDAIPELEEKRLYIDCRDEGDNGSLHIYQNMWKKIVTVNVL